MIAEPVTSKEFEVYLHQLARFAVDYYDNPCIYNVTPEVTPGFLYNNLPKTGPVHPESFDAIFNDIKTKIMPGLTHWQHPNFFGYYPIGRCFPDMLADFITSALAVIGFSWDSCPALTEMEHAMINWDSPDSSQGGGTLTESGSDAIFCAVLAARQWKINQIVEEQQRTRGMKYDTIHDIGKRLVVYSSKDAHSCIEKACKLAMVRYRPIQPTEENQWGITGEQIEEQIKKDLNRDLIPCFINCTLGTTSTASCDKLTSICPVAKQEGIENAHTINVNLSKFLLHSATLSIIWTREQKIYKDAFAITPIYLKPSAHGKSS
ncbi:pyridoxal-dependent decarboxylase domain protein [Ancylostoma ceylanicum]|uniref:Pyridoxal-dependent decarboxylase domain protein n=1 Tax=Ancylostoma ceylanicum TaxID=53326 RepID=A0A0D6LME1_9BILA|nr:pyridoxal-dependent decarboxylase domain protein [Ancylostoma ceylanicum]